MSVLHQNNYQETVAAPGTSIGATATPLSTVPSVAAPFYLTFDPENTNSHFEVVYCLTKGASDVTHAATTVNHTTGETVIMGHVAEELDAMWDDIATATATATETSPTGTIISYGKVSAPSGWLFCDGSAVSRTTYAALFAICSTSYGVGDGSTTFNLPDLQGKIPGTYKAADGNFGTLGASVGAKTYDLSHTHSLTTHTHTFGSGAMNGAPSSTRSGDGSPAEQTVANSGHTHTITAATIGNSSSDTSGSGGSATQNIMSKSLTVYYLIKT